MNYKNNYYSLITKDNTYITTILKHSKFKSKTCIKLIIKKNVLNRLILDNMLKLEIDIANDVHTLFDVKENKLISSSIYLNNIVILKTLIII